MKFFMSHYGYKSIPDTKFEADSSSSFGDMTSQNFPLKKGTSHEIRLFTARIVLLDPKLTPMSISAIFRHRKNFSFSKFLGRLDEKRAAATPLIDQFC